MIKKVTCLSIFLALFIYCKADGLFPEVPGWKMKINEKVYHSGDLWELINGAADIFLSYYFEDLNMAEYIRKDQMIRVELYRHKTFDDAYGIYTSERMPDYPPVQIGTLGYKSQAVLNFLAGTYYVKVMSAGVEEADEQSIALVASLVEKALAQPAQLPSILQLFPAEGQKKLSDTYIAQNFLGYSFFHHAFSIQYEMPEDFQMFIIKLTSPEISNILKLYTDMMKEDKTQQKEGMYVISDLFNGTVFLKQKNDYLIGIVNTENENIARKLISETELKIKE